MHAAMNARSIKWRIARNAHKLADVVRMSVVAWREARAVRRPGREQARPPIKKKS